MKAFQALSVVFVLSFMGGIGYAVAHNHIGVSSHNYGNFTSNHFKVFGNSVYHWFERT